MSESLHSAAAREPSWLRFPRFTLDRGRLAGLLVAGGCINGLVAQAEGNWRIEGAGTILAFFGFGFFVPFSIWVAVKLIARAGDDLARGALGAAALVYAAAVLAPSSLVAWGATLAYSGYLAIRLSGQPRWGALIVFGLSAVMIWTSAVIKAVSLQVTAFDARIVAEVFHLIGWQITRDGNLLTTPSGHNVLILMDCATLKRLPLGLLSCVSASLLTGNLIPARRLAASLALVALALTAMNAVRLTLLTLSPEAYAIVHGDIGKSVYDALETLFVVWIGLFLGERLGAPSGRRWRNARPGAAVVG